MRRDPDCELSLVIPFTDDEERVGAMSRRAAAHLSALGVRHEILAVDEDSGDNSVTLLGLLRVPSLQVLPSTRGHGFAAGARVARGRVLWLWDPEQAFAPFGALAWARRRVDDAGCDVAVVPGRFLVCRRTAAWRAVERAHGRGQAYERRLLAQARRRHLTVETPSTPSIPTGLFHRLLHLRRA